MLLSLSLAQGLEPYNQTHFESLELKGHDIVCALTSKVWSPIVWKVGRRLSMNFLSCAYAVLDFDDGRWSVEDAVEYCTDHSLAYLLGTTKSHGIAKGTLPACDRFRLIIPWGSPIEDAKAYTQNMRRFAADVPCDLQCFDLARCYQPCKRIVAMGKGGKLAWKPYAEPPPRPRPTSYENTSGVIPSWLRLLLMHSPVEGTRDKHTFKLAMSLAAFGYSESEVIHKVLQAPIGLSDKDKTRAAKSGYKIGLTKRKV